MTPTLFDVSTDRSNRIILGVMKNFINGAISLVNLILDGLVASARISCMSVTFRFPNQDREAAARIREGCWEAFTPHVVSLSVRESRKDEVN